MSENTDRSKPMSAHTPELLPCPFCGGEARLASYHSCDCCGKPYNAQVICGGETCGAALDHFDTDEQAVAAWNRRDDGWRTDVENAPKFEPLDGFNEKHEYRSVVMFDGREWHCLSHNGTSRDGGFYPTHWRELHATPTGASA